MCLIDLIHTPFAGTGFLPGLNNRRSLHDNYALLVLSFFVGSALCGSGVSAVAGRVLHLAHRRLGFSLYLLNGSSDLGPGVPRQIAYLALDASHRFVDCALHSQLINRFTSCIQLLTGRGRAAVQKGTQQFPTLVGLR